MSTRVRNWIWKTLRLSGLFVREIIGWVLMVLGLNVFRITFQYLNYAAVIEGFIAAMIGFFLFRGGLQLVKVAVAARALRADPRFRYARGRERPFRRRYRPRRTCIWDPGFGPEFGLVFGPEFGPEFRLVGILARQFVGVTYTIAGIAGILPPRSRC